MMLGHLRSRNVFVQRERVGSSLVRIDPVGRSLRWFNTIGRRQCLQCQGTEFSLAH